MHAPVYGKKTYAQLGKLVVARHQDLADDLIRNYLHVAAIDSELENIPDYYKRFTGLITSANWNDYPPGSYASKRLFISAMLRIYTPGVYKQPKNDLVLKYGLVIAVGAAIEYSKGYTSKNIRNVIAHEAIYEDYRNAVQVVVHYLTNEKAC